MHPSLSWFHLRNNARWTAVMVGVPYAVVALVVIAVLSFTRVRGGALLPGGRAGFPPQERLGAGARRDVPFAAQVKMYEGEPTFAEGVELGYYVWKDGELKSLKRIDIESETKVLYPGRSNR